MVERDLGTGGVLELGVQMPGQSPEPWPGGLPNDPIGEGPQVLGYDP